MNSPAASYPSDLGSNPARHTPASRPIGVVKSIFDSDHALGAYLELIDESELVNIDRDLRVIDTAQGILYTLAQARVGGCCFGGKSGIRHLALTRSSPVPWRGSAPLPGYARARSRI